MSIVRMKRLRLIGLSEERDELLSQLLHMGCVEVTEPEKELGDPEWMALLRRDSSTLSDGKAQLSNLTGAIAALKKYAKVKSGLFIKRTDVSRKEFFDQEAYEAALACASEINECTREIAKTESSKNKLNAARASLLPWVGLEIPLEMTSTKSTEVLLGTCPVTVDGAALQGDLAQATDLAQLTVLSADRDLQYFLLLVHKEAAEAAVDALRPHSFSVVHFKDMTGTARENIVRLEEEIIQQETRRLELEEQIIGRQDMMPALQRAQDRANQEVSKQTVRERFLTDGTIFFAEGWIPAEKAADLEEGLKAFTYARELTDPQEGETPPTLLKNPKWMRGINMVTEMYSLPAYDGIDPNPLMFFWYVFFFGFMFADVAYGIIIFLVSFIVTKKFKPKNTMGYMFSLGMWLGGSTALCGVFVGGFFGNVLEVFYENFLPNAVMPGWMQAFCDGLIVNPVNDPMTVLVIAIAIGCCHLIMGQCIHIYMGFRDGTGVDALLDVVPWWIVFAGIAVLALTGNFWVLVLGAVSLVATQGRHEATLFKKIFGGIKSLYDITSWLSDVLSYARLMALMLATSVIAQVFNTLGVLPPMPFKIFVFIIVFVIGHVFNIGVNLIGTYVHAARLQYLEYFGKFYKEGGIPFRPLKYNTKYVDINEEEN